MNQHTCNAICKNRGVSRGTVSGCGGPALAPGRGLDPAWPRSRSRPAAAKVDTATKWGNSMSNSGQLG